MDITKQISDGLQQGDDALVARLVREALDQGIDPQTLIDKGLIAGMDIVGEQFRTHEIFLPEVLLAAKAMNAGMEFLKPLLIKNGLPLLGKVVIGTVQGDIHDIGKNLVAVMLTGAGFDVIDLGTDVAPQKFVQTAVKENASVIGMSTLLTTTLPAMKSVIDLLKEKKLAGRIKTIIGGAPVNAEFARQIAADAYGYDAVNGVEQVKKLLKIKK
jgi:5-methyltetrahydrofolate--homocysteine methyltransferase